MSLARRVRGVPFEDLILWLAVGAVGVFLVWSAIRIRGIALPLYENSDIASAPVLAQFLPDQGSGHVTLGYYPWLESLFALDLTRWLPSHVSAWKAEPFVVYGLTVALAGWTVSRAISRRAGVVVALAMAAPAPYVIYMLGAPNQRLPTLAHTVIMAAFLVTLPSLGGWRAIWKVLWAAGLALTLAPGVASDPLVLLSAVLPFLVAVALGWRVELLRRDVGALAVGACVVGALWGVGLEHLAEHYRIVYNDSGFEMAGSGRVLSNTALLFEDVALFGHGTFATGRTPLNVVNTIRELTAIGGVIAVALFALTISRSPRALFSGSRSSQQRLIGAYWGASILAVSLAFVMITSPVGTNAVRYLTTLWPGLLTIAALLYGRRALNWLAALAAGGAVIGCIELQQGLYTPQATLPPDPDEVSMVQRFVTANHLDHGYAGYWDAMPVTLLSDFKVHAFPIEPCGPAPDRYCPFRVHTIESWYSPKPDVRSFYLVGEPSLDPSLGPPPTAWGPPIKIAELDDLTIYAYDYDIASNLRRLQPGTSPLPPVGAGP
jgi:hypothetical protein